MAPLRAPLAARIAVLSLLVPSLAACAGVRMRPDPIPTEEVVAMSEEGLATEEILTRVRESRTVYALRASEVKELLDRGVPEEVVDWMLETRVADLERRLRRSYDHPRYLYYSWGYPWSSRYCW